ncbi:FhuF 2Fe-2S C-terminal domain-containing protein [Actinacidiphila yanglinensis]|uniref:FhuF 2Fe-2S C-terminal domain-containing protein n=1 Tax=Actinacidiphila yanglinensis TaxID=310779 RepID=A0A1H5XHH6_9ACTN|nr:(2Fe-2S)-binding protein [Actinacidiphila yanglinensis]SEG11192.1 FhuF 2Fe-2S C-terminal domain-containing protein [Actinacidiphila yanglinensis]
MLATSASYARLSAVFPDLRVTTAPPPSGTGWIGARDLAEGGAALAAYVTNTTAELTGDRGRPPRPDVAATLALHRYLWPACLLFTVPWFLHGRVPRLPVDDVAFHPATGQVTVRTRSFGCLPDDPAATLPGARSLPHPAALRDELRAAVAEHAAPVLAGFGPLLRRGRHALWGMVTDEITEGLWYVGRLFDQEERARTELAALLPGRTPPFAGGAGFRRTTHSDGPSCDTDGAAPSRTRLTCCLYYTISPTDTCTTCPRRRVPDRIDRRASAA